MKTLLQAASGRIHATTAALVLAGDLVLVALFGAWLQISDSHTWQFVLSVLCALLLAAGFLWLQARLLRVFRGTLVPVWATMVALVLWVLVWWVANDRVADWLSNSAQRAGYWNSRMGAGMRHVFTYGHLQAWQAELVVVVTWLVIPAVLLPFVIETATQGPRGRSWLAAVRVLGSWQHWVVYAVGSLIGYWARALALRWTPAASPWLEVLSLAVRVGFVVVVGWALLMLLIAVDAELLHRRQMAAADPVPDRG